jgi:hypothetical protein
MLFKRFVLFLSYLAIHQCSRTYCCNLWYVNDYQMWIIESLILSGILEADKESNRWKRQDRWNNITWTNMLLICLFFCNSIKVLWPNAFHLTDLISAFPSKRKGTFGTYWVTALLLFAGTAAGARSLSSTGMLVYWT